MSAEAHGESTLIAARHLLGVGPDGARLDDAALLVRDGRIAALGPAAKMRAAHPGATVIERAGHVLCPGLVNAHAACGATLLRGAASDVPASRWQRDVAGPARRRWEGEGYVRDATELALCELLRGGVTCVNDVSTWPDIVARTFDRFGLRGRVAIPIEAEATAWAPTAAEAFSRGLAVRDQYRGHARIGFAFAPAAAGQLDDDTLARVRTLSDQLDEPVHCVLHETQAEIQQCLTEYSRRPLARLAAHGLVSPALIAAHANRLDETDVALLAERGAHVVHCPQVNLRFAHGRAPVEQLRSIGVNVALGSGGAAQAGRLDLFAEMRAAALTAKDASGSPATLGAAQLFHMATLGGARAMGLGEETGSLESGKWADLVCVRLSDAATQPVYDPLTALVWSASPEQVSDVWVAGRALVREGALIAADERKIVDNARAWAEKIQTT